MPAGPNRAYAPLHDRLILVARPIAKLDFIKCVCRGCRAHRPVRSVCAEVSVSLIIRITLISFKFTQFLNLVKHSNSHNFHAEMLDSIYDMFNISKKSCSFNTANFFVFLYLFSLSECDGFIESS